MQASHKVSAVFDDPNLIGSAGLVPVMRLAERAGLHTLLQEHLSVANPNAGVKAGCSPVPTASTTWGCCATAG